MEFRKNYTFRVYKNNKLIQRCSTHSRRRFLWHIGTINWQLKPLKVSLRVFYGKHRNVFNLVSEFFNEGDYFTKKDLLQAFKAFDELEEKDFE